MGLFSRQRNTQTKHELVRRQNHIDEITAIALEAHSAIGSERRAAAQTAHETLQQAQQMLDEAGPDLSAACRMAAFYRVLACQYEILDLTNQWISRLIK